MWKIITITHLDVINWNIERKQVSNCSLQPRDKIPALFCLRMQLQLTAQMQNCYWRRVKTIDRRSLIGAGAVFLCAGVGGRLGARRTFR